MAPHGRDINLDEYDEKGKIKKKKRDMSDLQVIKRIIGFLRQDEFDKYMKSLMIVIVLGAIGGFLFPAIFGNLIKHGLGDGDISLYNYDEFNKWSIYLIIAMFFQFALWIAQQYLILYLANSVMHQMRGRIFRNLQKLSFDYYDDKDRSSGKIISYMINDVETIHGLISSGLLNIVANIINLIGSFFLMIYISPHLSLVSFLVITVIILVGVPFLLKARQYFVIMRQTVGKVTGRLQESISGSRLIKAFASEDEDRKKFEIEIKSELEINLKVQKLFAAMPGVIMSLLGGGIGIMLLVSANLLDSGILSGASQVITFSLYMIQFFGPIVGIVMFINEIQNSMTAGERVIKLVDRKPTVANKTETLILTNDGMIIYNLVKNNKKTLKTYNPELIDELKLIIEDFDEYTINFFIFMGDLTEEISKSKNKIQISKKINLPKNKFINFCDNYTDLFEPYKKSNMVEVKLSDKGFWLYSYLKSKKKANKKIGAEKIDQIVNTAEKMSKDDKKLIKNIGSGKILALRFTKSMEVDFISERFRSPKVKLIKLQLKFNRFVEYQKPYELTDIKGHIEFKDVKFSYISGIPIIKNLTMDIKAGERIAIVGYTGAGKSTIINLLARFYDIDGGSILIDDHDIKDINIQSLRQKMGTVLQDNFLFSGTVMDNIKYGKRDSTDEEVMEAAMKVGAHEFIKELPKGYNTKVEERGNLLSIGQKQLIAFTRALIRDPPILILDEATSAVDPYSELIIQQALEVLLENRTSISIAHRLSTIINSDKIFCLKDGEIVETGPHSELIKNNEGLYHNLYTLQYRDPFETD